MPHVQRKHRFVVLVVAALIGVVVLSVPVGSPARATGVQTAGTSLVGVSCWSPEGSRWATSWEERATPPWPADGTVMRGPI